MPIYEFMCNSCEHSFDVRKQMSQMDKPETCSLCGDTAHRNVIASMRRTIVGIPKADQANEIPYIGRRHQR